MVSVLNGQPAPVLTTIRHFAASADGLNLNDLTLGIDGYLYGTSYAGGTNWNPAFYTGFGTVFKVDTQGNLIWAVSFAGTNGGNPNAGLVEADDGSFYGTTCCGGAQSCGTVFKVSASGALTTVFSFNGTNGYSPGRLLQAKTGQLYGTTAMGGPGCSNLNPADALGKGFGTVFTISTAGLFANLFNFGGTNGASPNSPLLDGGDGNVYGTTALGGVRGDGTAFQMSPSGSLTPLHSFSGGDDGSSPQGALVRGNDGNLYGVTQYGGPYENLYNYGGTVFRLQTNGVLTTLACFDGTNGCGPNRIIQASEGVFYATTAYGGAFTNEFGFEPPFIGSPSDSYGTVFKLGADWAVKTVIAFNLTNGVQPSGILQARDGSFYGATAWGGTNGFLTVSGPFASGGDGTVFHLTLLPVRPRLEGVALEGSTLQLKWNAELGNIYRVQFKDGLSEVVWQDLGSDVPATNTTMTASDFIGAGQQRFYRLLKLSK